MEIFRFYDNLFHNYKGDYKSLTECLNKSFVDLKMEPEVAFKNNPQDTLKKLPEPNTFLRINGAQISKLADIPLNWYFTTNDPYDLLMNLLDVGRYTKPVFIPFEYQTNTKEFVLYTYNSKKVGRTTMSLPKIVQKFRISVEHLFPDEKKKKKKGIAQYFINMKENKVDNTEYMKCQNAFILALMEYKSKGSNSAYVCPYIYNPVENKRISTFQYYFDHSNEHWELYDKNNAFLGCELQNKNIYVWFWDPSDGSIKKYLKDKGILDEFEKHNKVKLNKEEIEKHFISPAIFFKVLDPCDTADLFCSREYQLKENYKREHQVETYIRNGNVLELKESEENMKKLNDCYVKLKAIMQPDLESLFGKRFQLYPLGRDAYFEGRHQGVSSNVSQQTSQRLGVWHPQKSQKAALPSRTQFQFGKRMQRKPKSCFGSRQKPNEYGKVFNSYLQKYQDGFPEVRYGYHGTQGTGVGFPGYLGRPALSKQTIEQGLIPY